ncbi:MAG: MBL fold metallo-hydrolase [Candidatus Thermoplasmatota archaeon]
MKVEPVASDSLGVRSMATYVETKDCKIFIDPSAALGPKRYGLPPSSKEKEKLKEIKEKIAEKAKKCDILTISHYHYDHFELETSLYNDKKVFAKDIKQNINYSQTKRGKKLKDKIEEKCRLIYADNSSHKFGDTEIHFSPGFFHGPENVKLGYVIMATIKDKDKKMVHSSDVQGPVTKQATDYIIKQKPDLLIMDGPPTMLLGWRFSKQNLQDASNNLNRIIDETNCEVILDHHLLRDLKYKEKFSEPYQRFEDKIKTFAEYIGEKNNTLEAYRKKLWGKI